MLLIDPLLIGYHGNKFTVCSYLFWKCHQVSRYWLVQIWSSEPFTGLEVETPPGMKRGQSSIRNARTFGNRLLTVKK